MWFPVSVLVCVRTATAQRVYPHAAHRAPAPTRAPARGPLASTVMRAPTPGPSGAQRGGAAHRNARLVSAESDAGTVPVIALVCKDLRSPPPHGRRPGVPHTHARPGG